MKAAPLLLACISALAVALPVQSRAADGLGPIVRAVCLSAFENELSQAGKAAPPGMAAYACSCVEQRILAGGAIETARTACRQATAERYPI
ncbi:MAG: hypothetical protein ACKOZT_13245 [Cyanobium sp.]